MDKQKLEKFVTKYHLAGSCELVLLESDGTDLKVKCQPESKNLIAKVKGSGFGIAKTSLAVTDTKRLKAILGVLGDTIKVSLNDTDGRVTSISLVDSTTKAQFAVGLPAAVPPVKDVASLPPMNIEFSLDEAFTGQFIKSKAALGDVSAVTFLCDGNSDEVEVILGYSKNNTNRITLKVNAPGAKKTNPVHFSAHYLNQIIVANKDAEKSVLKVTDKGLLVAEFEDDGIESKYYLLGVDIQ